MNKLCFDFERSIFNSFNKKSRRRLQTLQIHVAFFVTSCRKRYQLNAFNNNHASPR